MGKVLTYALLLVAVALLIFGRHYRIPTEICYSNLLPADAHRCVEILKKNGIPSKLSENEDIIYVPKASVFRARVTLATQPKNEQPIAPPKKVVYDKRQMEGSVILAIPGLSTNVRTFYRYESMSGETWGESIGSVPARWSTFVAHASPAEQIAEKEKHSGSYSLHPIEIYETTGYAYFKFNGRTSRMSQRLDFEEHLNFNIGETQRWDFAEGIWIQIYVEDKLAPAPVDFKTSSIKQNLIPASDHGYLGLHKHDLLEDFRDWHQTSTPPRDDFFYYLKPRPELARFTNSTVSVLLVFWKQKCVHVRVRKHDRSDFSEAERMDWLKKIRGKEWADLQSPSPDEEQPKAEGTPNPSSDPFAEHEKHLKEMRHMLDREHGPKEIYIGVTCPDFQNVLGELSSSDTPHNIHLDGFPPPHRKGPVMSPNATETPNQ